jgi:hypothetical protein
MSHPGAAISAQRKSGNRGNGDRFEMRQISTPKEA